MDTQFNNVSSTTRSECIIKILNFREAVYNFDYTLSIIHCKNDYF